ncbi:15-hydroxyprostaglandin dehydrogenase [NAD(+)] [Aplysia californica]|uniref:15-hydroxyprostaglandin dehydrogenase [NAD(+)] n=1 Tax=Aplysia californica TaxID=6500 RepID=A0ABM0JG42_APLCA|nr:15-hydroxyprostaglandin dehydrogenase [NAD(+)] [Aplysia californica]
MYEVKNKVVFITGGAQGLGRAYGQAVLQKGAKLFFVDVNASAGEVAEKELKDLYGADKVRFCPLDVTDKEKYEEVFETAVSHFGCVDVMVCNAGILNESTWELMIQVNLMSTVRGTKLALEHMRKDKGGRGGRIINISSIMGLYDHNSQPIYGGTKQAVRSFTSSMAMQPNLVSSTGVELACLCPDATCTNLMIKLDNTKLFSLNNTEHFDYDSVKDHLVNRMMQIPTVVNAFLKLLQLQEMNGAILLTTKTSTTFQRMSCDDQGEEFPPPTTE